MMKCLASDKIRSCGFVLSLYYCCHCSFPVLPGVGRYFTDLLTACASARTILPLICYQLRKYPVIITIHIYSKPSISEFTSQGFNFHNLCWILNSRRFVKHSLENGTCQTFISSAILFMHRWMPLLFTVFPLVFPFYSFCKECSTISSPRSFWSLIFCFNLHQSIFITIFHTFASSSLIL